MALLEETRLLVGDLELAASRRAREERERQEAAAQDARERAREERERQEAAAQDARERAREGRERQESAAQDARERAARIASRRIEVGETLNGFHQERATLAWGTPGRGAGMASLRGVLGRGHQERDAQGAAAERAASIAGLPKEVAQMLSGFHQERLVRAAWDALGRVEDERDRQATAAQDARERATEILGLRGIWGDHAATMGSVGLRPPRRL
jgi:colicin import membrane protein